MLAAEAMNATLAQWIEWAGVDLDTSLDMLPQDALVEEAPSSPDGRHPMLRTWGLELRIQVNYYNYGLISSASLSPDLHCVIKVMFPHSCIRCAILHLPMAQAGAHVHAGYLHLLEAAYTWP